MRALADDAYSSTYSSSLATNQYHARWTLMNVRISYRAQSLAVMLLGQYCKDRREPKRTCSNELRHEFKMNRQHKREMDIGDLRMWIPVAIRIDYCEQQCVHIFSRHVGMPGQTRTSPSERQASKHPKRKSTNRPNSAIVALCRTLPPVGNSHACRRGMSTRHDARARPPRRGVLSVSRPRHARSSRARKLSPSKLLQQMTVLIRDRATQPQVKVKRTPLSPPSSFPE